jgi:hypothetical protein
MRAPVSVFYGFTCRGWLDQLWPFAAAQESAGNQELPKNWDIVPQCFPIADSSGADPASLADLLAVVLCSKKLDSTSNTFRQAVPDDKQRTRNVAQ